MISFKVIFLNKQPNAAPNKICTNITNIYIGIAFTIPDIWTNADNIIGPIIVGPGIFNLTAKNHPKNEIKKTYWAIVKLVVDKASGKLEDYLTKNPKQNKSYVTNSLNKKAKKAILYYESILNLDNYSLLKIKLETGRHHQIRTQLSKIGMSIKGDLKYGFPRPNSNGSIHLHSRKTTFIHPVTKKEVIIVAPPPIDKIWDKCLKMIE